MLPLRRVCVVLPLEPAVQFLAAYLLSTVDLDGRNLDYHGDVRFYASKKDLGQAEDGGSGLVKFVARFTHSDLKWIRPVG